MAARRRYTHASTEHKSVDDMLNRLDLGDPNYIPLGWKESVLDKKIFRSRYADLARFPTALDGSLRLRAFVPTSPKRCLRPPRYVYERYPPQFLSDAHHCLDCLWGGGEFYH